ncbi:putative monovalent cation/H+ antiporter subunit D [gamma proteobacterium BDW918]|jgi:multicomponent Na+:H+ antiporter subunit D|uniref:Cation:proton antiporter n=1 Tax=Zhongshania aliphaticivorans TaxID=1470434 RepID=A0A127M5D8_9GAMM|nr:Na(+)/H(+) antiporter subunit D [Zhongshania aliphaticivorans]AMO68460.1 cation:proton antiporter [Zhongshania aliphaticivorans]EIF43069.1 putative monovalent cation/H+ antiporter subunit D [gamma proteobacterium BDW918]
MLGIELPPFLIFYLGALIALVGGATWRGPALIVVVVVSALNLWQLPSGFGLETQLMGMALKPIHIDRLSLLFGYLFHIAALISVIYSLHIKDKTQQVAAMLYAGSALGAVFAGDLLTLFIFWEMLAVTSVFLIWARRTDTAYSAGMRYLIIQVISGLLLLVGIILYFKQNGSLMFTEIGLDSIASWFMFLAFGIKCAFPFFHNWLTDAYPEATPTGTVFLSAFTTKVAVYAMARGFPGTEMLVYIGATMACFPIFFAVIENDLRRVLAYSLVNQLGFMMVGIGIGTELGINGAVAHAFNDVIFKGLLFMSMGAVLYRTGRINGSELGGLYKSMPKTAILCIVGAASISAFPLFSGFVSKSMIMSAALKEHFNIVWLLLLFASAGVFHHAGIKIPYFAFFAHDSGIRCKEAPWNMLLAMSIAATLCLAIGIFPQLLYQHLPFPTDYSAYDVSHILTQTQLLFFSALAFVWLNLKGMYPPELPSTNLDFDWMYRRPLPRLINACGRLVNRVDLTIRSRIMGIGNTLEQRLAALNSGEGVFSRTISISSMAAWMVTLLALLLIIRFF